MEDFIYAFPLRGFYGGFIGELLGPQPACSPFKGCCHHAQNYFNFYRRDQTIERLYTASVFSVKTNIIGLLL